MSLSDDIYLGPTATGTGTAGFNVGATTAGIGPTGRNFVYDIVPLTLAANNLATSQSPGTAALFLTAGAGVTSVTGFGGVTALQLDVPRALRFVSGGIDTGITFNVVGYDYLGQAMTEHVTGASAGTATGLKAWYQVVSITPSASVSTTITVGTTDVFGLPVYVKDAAYIGQVKWNNTLAADAGTLVTGVTTTATSTTGDVRGTYTPSANASNGIRRLVVNMLLSQANVGSTATRATALGVTQA